MLQPMQPAKPVKRQKKHYLREWAAARGFKPKDLIDATGADKGTVSRWLSGSEPSLEYLAALGRLFGVSDTEFYRKPAPARREVTYHDDDPAAPTPEEASDFDPDAFLGTAGLVHGRVVFTGKIPGSSPETQSRGGLGAGQVLDSGVARIESNGIASGHPVAAEWVIPPSFLRHGLGGTPSNIIIVPVTGHSMEPRLVDGDRVIVDLSQNDWIGDAIYLIDDGSTVFQAKTLKKVTSSSPARFLIISESDKDHPDERRFDEFRIVGRVVGRISKP